MLKSLSQSRNSPAQSPRFHYAPASKSSPPSTSSRRTSKSTYEPPSPRSPRAVQYVDAATQWSTPIMNAQEQPSAAKSTHMDADQVPRPEPATPPVVVAKAPHPSASSVPVKIESPGKRRQSRVELFINGKGQISRPKRVKAEETSVKILPAEYEFCDVEDLVVLISNMISELIQTNDSLPLRSGVLTRFHSRTPPGISVLDYLQRLAKHATLTPPLLLSMVYYIDRLCSLYPAFTINTLTVHRFLITAATVAAKGLSDSFWNNATYARVGGIKITELGLLELDFLYRVDWRIVPDPEVLVDYYRGLVERSEGYEIEVTLDSSAEEDDDTVEAIEESQLDSGSKSEVETDTKWKEWMQDVSAKAPEETDGNPHKEGTSKNASKNAASEKSCDEYTL